ncbi:DUF1150 domain-containing protein [Loktanella sp. IMCC34160]|uniref:DUF1150 family protein n=1 Tax=Loktanella sp. IMCC34160 TaxID=2510646 RepID=UPI00101BBB54|nr:DUF1150 family protein [Loktanella sp. IMCC34160]RYG90691.1 DUF1150 domain-containing protein [Loktanella sp. IMCC34160]
MNTKFDLSTFGQGIVYIRPVNVDDLPADVQAQAEAGGLKQLFAVHNTDGDRLALVADRTMAFVLARQHDMTPVTVH